MTRLSDTQLVILGAAAQRDDLSVLPLPDSLTLKGGALNKVMDSPAQPGPDPILGGDGGPERVVITSEGMAAIGVEADDDEAPAAADTTPTSVEADVATDTPAPPSEADGAQKRAKTKPTKGQGKKARTTARATNEPEVAGKPSPKPTPRAGTKQAQMIELLKRPEGATVEQIAAATGWQHHTIRGAISGALKKKLGLTVEATRTRESARTRRVPRAAAPSTGSPAERGSADMQSLLKQPGYRLHLPDSPEARALLAEQGLGPADLERALAHLEHAEGIRVRTVVGINEDGVFAVTRAGWQPDLPDACHEPFIPLLWLKVHELLGRVPRGQHGTVRQGRYDAGRSPGRTHRLPDGQLKRRPEH